VHVQLADSIRISVAGILDIRGSEIIYAQPVWPPFGHHSAEFSHWQPAVEIPGWDDTWTASEIGRLGGGNISNVLQQW